MSLSSPDIVVHRLEEEFLVRAVQLRLEIRERDDAWTTGNLHHVRRFFLVDVVDDLGLLHGVLDLVDTSLELKSSALSITKA